MKNIHVVYGKNGLVSIENRGTNLVGMNREDVLNLIGFLLSRYNLFAHMDAITVSEVIESAHAASFKEDKE